METLSTPAPRTSKEVLQTYLTTRVPGGRVRREKHGQKGDYFVEVRVYDTDEAASAVPDQRWKHAQVTLKVKLNRETPQWGKLQEFMRRAHDLFEECEPVFFKELK